MGADGSAQARRLDGRYELGAVLGRGGMATVRRGTDLRLGRTVAVKTLHGELTEAPSFQARFRREARAAAALHHPAIVSVYDAGEDTVDDALTCYIVMEYVDGDTLRDLLRAGAWDPHRALEITAAVLDALAESHRCGIVHRDIKPANVMVTRSGAVKVMDFGVARAVADISSSLTQTATVIGTAHYLSPEQARGEAVDARSDVYSTGCLLYELLTGRPPFQGDSAISVAYQHVREAARPPSAFDPSLPPEVDAILLTALAKDPGERYQSAEQMRGDIQAVLAGGQATGGPVVGPAAGGVTSVYAVPEETTSELQPVVDTAGHGTSTLPPLLPPPAPSGGPNTLRARWRRRRTRVLVAAVAVVLAAGLGGFALSTLGDDPAPRRDAERAPGAGRTPSDRPAPLGGSAGEPAPAGLSGPDRPVDDEGGVPRPDAGRGTDADGGVREDPVPDGGGGLRPQLTRDADQPAGTPTVAETPQETATEEPTPTPTTPEETTPSEEPSESPTPEPSPSEEPTPTTSTTQPDGSASLDASSDSTA